MSLVDDLLARLNTLERQVAKLQASGPMMGVIAARLPTTNTVVDISREERTTTGTAADGIGSGHVWMLQDASGNVEEAANIDVLLTTAAHATQAAEMRLGIMGATVVTLAAKQLKLAVGDTSALNIRINPSGVNWDIGTEVTTTDLLIANGNGPYIRFSKTPALKVSFLGAVTLGAASTDAITCTGRLKPRTTASDPQHATAGSRPAGTVGEIAFYGNFMYYCTNAATPTWMKLTAT